jgi:hexosaminidase
MTPGNPLYIDHYQGDPALEPIAIGGFNSLKKVYEYDPVPKELSQEEGKYILGAQANLWTEYITTPMHATYMLLPRMLALAEITWSPAAKKDWNDFNRRLQAHFTRFDQQGIPYSKGNFKPSIHPLTENGKMRASLSTEVFGGKIHFTTDGTMPGLQSQVYSMPVAIDSSMYLQAVTVLNGAVLPGSPAQQYFTMHKAVGKQVSYIHPQSSSYSADGAHSLTDGIKGTDNIGKYWHGFYDNDLIATIDLEQVQSVERITLGCLQKYRDWIFLPEKVDVEISTEGNQYTKIAEIQNDVPATETTTRMKNFTASFSAVPAQYIRITAKKIDGCPPGHPGAGKPGWIFADEIEVH